MVSELEQTDLWNELTLKTSPSQLLQVKNHAKRAADLLFLIRDTFPTYTLHNELHALNVIELMGKLLGDKIIELSGLECTFLILSAYYHDIGMVFSPDEKQSITEETNFRIFIQKFPKAQLDFMESNNNNCISDDLAEWYCRWIHPERSAKIIKSTDSFLWDNYYFEHELAEICRSHGDNIEQIVRSNNLNTNFLQSDTDSLFCAIILRLADILDFDNSRAPEEVYKYLGISKRKTPRTKMSDVEWLKHLCSSGFIFGTKHRIVPYEITFVARPEEPAVEYDIREFIKIITTEIGQCSQALKSCSDKWKSFMLPVKINTSQIISNGYSYGNYKFALDKNNILNLLMGENLYSDQYVFIRELAQNAIDTTRHRQIHEFASGNLNFIPSPIKFSTWTDEDGYTWIRIDDYGMGMDEDILTKYFLQIGVSYYQSDEFKLQKKDWESKSLNLNPISKFGIGILSCFIVANKIEISTRRFCKDISNNAIRMSMFGINEFFVIKQEQENHSPTPMPNENRIPEKYRSPSEFGTSIAIRLSPKKETADFNFGKIINKYISCSPIPILFEEQIIGGDYERVIKTKWVPNRILKSISEEQQKGLEKTLKRKFSGRIKVEITPIDFTSISPTSDFAGQGIIVKPIIPIAIPNLTEFLMFPFYYWEGEVRISIRTDPDKRKVYATIGFESSRSLFLAKFFPKYVKDRLKENSAKREHFLDIELEEIPFINRLSHNGIYIPSYKNGNAEYPKLGKYTWYRDHATTENTFFDIRVDQYYNKIDLYYSIALMDDLRPDLSIARDSVKNIPMNILSIANLIVPQAIDVVKFYNINFLNVELFTLGDYLNDKYIGIDKAWGVHTKIPTSEGELSIIDIRLKAKKGKDIFLNYYITIKEPKANNNYSSFVTNVSYVLIQTGLKIRLEYPKMNIRILDENIPILSDAIKKFPPIFFLEYDNKSHFRTNYFPPNSAHPFSVWLIENHDALQDNHPGLLGNIKQAISTFIDAKGDISCQVNKIVTEVNSILDRLKRLNFAGKPTGAVYLSESSFNISKQKEKRWFT